MSAVRRSRREFSNPQLNNYREHKSFTGPAQTVYIQNGRWLANQSGRFSNVVIPQCRRMDNRAENRQKRSSRSNDNYRSLHFRESVRNGYIPFTPVDNFRRKDGNRRHDKIRHLRMFNNWAKSYLMLKGISHYPNVQTIIGLDLGCSKGTDLKKWHHCRMDHLYLVENDPSAMQECRNRYIYLRNTWQNFYKASFIMTDMWSEGLSIPKVIDMVSCQMALHKAFESRSKAENLARNISNSLKYGGIFVASLTCSTKILDSLKDSSSESSFGNSVFQIKLQEPLPTSIPEFGLKFQFVVGQNLFEEYLVQKSVLEQVMAKYGLVLEEEETFLDIYFAARRSPDQILCMHKMGVIRES